MKLKILPIRAVFYLFIVVLSISIFSCEKEEQKEYTFTGTVEYTFYNTDPFAYEIYVDAKPTTVIDSKVGDEFFGTAYITLQDQYVSSSPFPNEILPKTHTIDLRRTISGTVEIFDVLSCGTKADKNERKFLYITNGEFSTTY